jgi:hypothetical protein
MWKRRLAVQLASQLPEDPADARAVLDATRQLLDEFLVEKRPQVAKIIGLVSPPVAPKPPETGVEPKTERKGWGRGYKATAATVIATLLMAFTVPIEPGTASGHISTVSAFLPQPTVTQGEPLRLVMTLVHTFDCPGTTYRVVTQGGREVISATLPARPTAVGTMVIRTSRVPTWDLLPGDYEFAAWTDFVCSDGYRERAAIPAMPFRIVEAAVGP